MIELFEQYPRLGRELPHISLGEFPTPVHKLTGLAGEIDVGQLYIKRDDLSGNVYGGNKIRKHEFLLGQAIRSGKKEVMTFGLAGSKSPMAAAIC
ncbi:MAG: D-cysteine desulfhydrase family protein, partial [Dehalococcoidia bacterium]|nr:D-cysteine desulfhydrase family protein [Dehalococcoidia bacterium]